MSQTAHSLQTPKPADSSASQTGRGISIQVNRVQKTFHSRGREVDALQTIDLDIPAGEFVCLLGPSGCGKSTLLNIIAGLDRPSSGEVIANGVAVRGTGTDRVLLFQEAALFPWLDVQRNVEFGLRQAGMPAAERKHVAQRYIDLVHLTGFEQSFVHQLSGGMRQRTAIARALAIDPAALLMDEPFGALDAMTRDLLHHELEQIWQQTGKTILFVTHNVREAIALGDRVLIFSPRPGRILRDIRIDLPRPRLLEDHALVDLAAEMVSVLHQGQGG